MGLYDRDYMKAGRERDGEGRIFARLSSDWRILAIAAAAVIAALVIALAVAR